MRSRAESLEFALLGLLSQSDLHGYELRKRLSAIFGPLRALSFSVLYPQLRKMTEAGLVTQREVPRNSKSKRTRVVYSISEKGKARFADLTERNTPASWDDDNFEVHVAFFSPTSKRNRLRILEGRHELQNYRHPKMPECFALLVRQSEFYLFQILNKQPWFF